MPPAYIFPAAPCILPISHAFDFPLGHVVVIPVFLGRHAGNFPELLYKMALGRKRKAVCNVNNGIFAVPEQVFGFLNLLPADIGANRIPCFLFKQP